MLRCIGVPALMLGLVLAGPAVAEDQSAARHAAPSKLPIDLSPSPAPSVSSDDDWRKDVTVLAIAPDGTWGTATEPSIGRALANAINDCKSKYQGKIGCGYRSITIRAGWSLAFRCGSGNIIVGEKTLAGAERSAARREHELRAQFVPDMLACVRTVTVDPSGAVVAPAFARREEAVQLR